MKQAGRALLTMSKTKRALLMLFMVSFCFPMTALNAFAATITVTEIADNGAGTLRQAIQDADSGDSILFSLGTTDPLTLTLGSELVVNKDLVIDGTGSRMRISGNNSVRVFSIGSGATVTLRNMEIMNGRAVTGAGISNSGTLTIENCTFTGNRAQGGNGGNGYSYFGGGGGGFGGGLHNNGGAVSIVNSTFQGNQAAGGNGGTVDYGFETVSGPGGAMNGGNGNSAGGFGGGAGSCGTSGCSLAGGFGAGGGVRQGSGGGAGMGGAIFNQAGSVSLRNATLSGNSASGGSRGCYMSCGGNGSGVGGGVFVYEGSVDVVNTIVAGNSAVSGADLYRFGTATLSLVSSLYQTAGTDSGIAINGSDLNNLSGDPRLGTLLDNGGLTRTMALQPGSPAIDAVTEGENNFNNAPSLDQTGYARSGNYDMGAVEAGKASQTIDFTAPAGATYLDPPFTVTAGGGASGLPVTFSILSGPATATGENGATITLTGAGSVTIRAAQAGNDAYLGAPMVDRTITVVKAAQTITFDPLPEKEISTADFDPGATASSGLAASYASSATEVATIVNGKIHVTGLGTTEITATQAGNGNFNAAPPVAQTLTVTKADQSIAFGPLPQKWVGDLDFNPLASATSGLSVNYQSSNSAVATVVGRLIHIVGAGSTVITASQPGNGYYAPAADVEQTLTVGGHALFTVASTADSGPGTLRQAILDASAGDGIRFSLGTVDTQTITLSSELALSKDVLIDGTASRVRISGNNSVRVFSVSAGVTVTLKNIEIVNGRAVTGAGIFNSGTLTLENCTLSGNRAQGGNGGIGWYPGGGGAGFGGGLYNNGGIVSIVNGTLQGNQAAGGNGGPRDTSGPVYAAGGSMNGGSGGSGGGFGGGAGGCVPSCGGGFGGGGSDWWGAGGGAGMGGAIFNQAGSVFLLNATLSGNSATGGSRSCDGSDCGGNGSGIGGGVFLYNGTVDAVNTIVAGNTAASGADIYRYNLNPAVTLSLVSSLTGSTASNSGIAVNGTNLNNLGGDPLLGTLLDNGGWTRTMAPQPGSPAINVMEEGGNNYNGAPALDQTGYARSGNYDIGAVETGKIPQSIVFDAIADRTYIDSFSATAIGGASGAPVSFSVVSGPATATGDNGATITFTGIGLVTIRAEQPGNYAYSGASQDRSFTVAKADQTITFDTLPTKDLLVADLDPGATASPSGLSVSYASSNTGVATIVSGKIHITGLGTTEITATQPGNGNFNAAVPVVQTLTVTKAAQTITFDALPAKSVGDLDFDPLGSSSSGLTVAYHSSNPVVAVISGHMVRIMGEGSTVITASQIGNAYYAPAVDAQQTLTVGSGVSHAVINVTSTANSGAGTLRQAILDAAAGDTVRFSLGTTEPQTITLASELALSKDVMIDGTGGRVRISGNNSVRVFSVSSGVTVMLRNIEIMNGRAVVGAGISNSGTLTLENCTLTGNRAQGGNGGNGSSYYGGGGGGGGGFGGGVYNNGGSVSILNSTLQGNQAAGGNGGGYDFWAGGYGAGGAMNGGNGSSAGGFGGGAGSCDDWNCSRAGGFGGGGGVMGGSGGGAGIGGAIFNQAGSIFLLNATLSGNSATGGSRGCHGSYCGNNGAGIGGGLFVYDGAVDIVNTIATGNTANSGADLYRYNLNPAVTINLISSFTNTTASNSGTPINGTNLNNLTGDPLLGALMDNGGWTRTMSLQAGSPAIDAVAEGGNSFNNAPALDQTGYARSGDYDMGAVEAGKASQSITFTAPADRTYIDSPFTVSATGGASGNPIIFSIISGPATATGLNGATVTLTGTGTVTVRAEQAGNNLYTGTSLDRSFAVSKADQAIAFDILPTRDVFAADFSPGATATSGLTVSYASSTSSVATIVNGNIHITGEGTTDITATQAGNGNFNAAPPVVRTLTVTKAAQTVTFDPLPEKSVGDLDFDPLASASSGLAVNYHSSVPAVAMIVGRLVRIVGAGSTVITASQPGNGYYGPASDVQQTLTVVSGDGHAVITVTSTADSGEGTLRQAIQDALPGDSIQFSPGAADPQTITLDSELALSKDVMIDGTGSKVRISGNNSVRVFSIGAGVTVMLRNIEIMNGRAVTGAGIYNNGTLTVENCTFIGNRAQGGNGGAGYYPGGGGGGFGGALFNSGGIVSIVNSTLQGNQAAGGNGGPHVSNPFFATGGSMNGGSGGAGGGFGGGAGGCGSSCGGGFGGGGSYWWGSGGGAGMGGAIFNQAGSVFLLNDTLSGNSATGGSLSCEGSYCGGDGSGIGGGVFVYDGAVDVVNTITTGNSANSGADLYRYNLKPATMLSLVSSIYQAAGTNSGTAINGTNLHNLTGDPLLGTLFDNGGWTRTMALQPGSPAIDAVEEGGNDHNGAPNLDQTGYARSANFDMGAVEAGKASQTIVFDSLEDRAYIDPPFTVTAAGGASWNPLRFSIVSGPATATGENGATITLTGMGTVTIRAEQAGSDAFLGSSLERSFFVLYAVTFESNGGSAVTRVAAGNGATFSAPADPTKSGHTFAGWYKEPELTTHWDFGTDTVPATNITLYARWTINPYTVSFDSNGGSAVGSISTDFGSTIGVPTAPTRAGYAFAGWYKEAGLNNPWHFGNDTITGNTTLYAKWISILAVTITGTGAGTVTSVPSGISCTHGSCNNFYSGTVDLYATPSSLSLFGGWSGACTGTETPCSIAMDGSQTVTATFNVVPLLQIDGTTYASLQQAYDAAATGAVIQLLADTLHGALDADRDVEVQIRGGYDAGYVSNPGTSAVTAPLIIRQGRVEANSIVIR